jgi:hypothetical protein
MRLITFRNVNENDVFIMKTMGFSQELGEVHMPPLLRSLRVSIQVSHLKYEYRDSKHDR